MYNLSIGLGKLWLLIYIQLLGLINNVKLIQVPNMLNIYVFGCFILENSFLLIPRGECAFVTKALHAQEMGAKMAIIMDNL
jgi:hypothetical protein